MCVYFSHQGSTGPAGPPGPAGPSGLVREKIFGFQQPMQTLINYN